MNRNILEERLNEVRLAWSPSYTTLQGEEVGVLALEQLIGGEQAVAHRVRSRNWSCHAVLESC